MSRGPAFDRCREQEDEHEASRITNAEVKRGAPALRNLLNAVFHTDWRDDFDSAREALEADLSRYGDSDRQLVHEEAA